MSNKAANLAIQARVELEIRISLIRTGVKKEADTLKGNIEVQGVWGSANYSKHKYFDETSEGSGLDCGWWGDGRPFGYGYCQAKSKAKWNRSGKASRRAANRV